MAKNQKYYYYPVMECSYVGNKVRNLEFEMGESGRRRRGGGGNNNIPQKYPPPPSS